MNLFTKNNSLDNQFQNKDVLVIGAGRFGSSIAKTIHKLGGYVLLIDISESKLRKLDGQIGQTIVADATDENVLKSIEVENFDVAVVAIGRNLNSSILTTVTLKELGVKNIICKAVTETQAKTLYKLGADKVVFPERDTGVRVAYNLLSRNILDSVDLGPDYSVIELTTLEQWHGKSIVELGFRNAFNLNVLAIKKGEELEITPNSHRKLDKNDILLILGKKDDLQKLIRS